VTAICMIVTGSTMISRLRPNSEVGAWRLTIRQNPAGQDLGLGISRG